jgi:hypothetical protein
MSVRGLTIHEHEPQLKCQSVGLLSTNRKPRFEYQPLGSQSECIRLLQLLPPSGSPDQQPELWYERLDLECTLTIQTLDDISPYDALSYAWGDNESSVAITINGKEMHIRAKLAYALAALRASCQRTIWVDALCINQDSPQERNHQVRLMGDIYRCAKQVFVWLGRPGVRTNLLATHTVEMMTRLGKFFPCSKLPPPPPEPSFPQEQQFDEWISSLRVHYNDDKLWETTWHKQNSRWLMMKEDRTRLQWQKQRMPELIEALGSISPCYIKKRKELQKLQAQQAKECAELESLRSMDWDIQKEMDGPNLRLLQAFGKRQSLVLKKAVLMIIHDRQDAEILRNLYFSEERLMTILQPLHNPDSYESDSSVISRLYRQIHFNLGSFHRAISDMGEKLEEKKAKQSTKCHQYLDGERQRLRKLNSIEKDELRHFRKLYLQRQAWLRLEYTQSESLRSMKNRQDMVTNSHIKEWDACRKDTLRKFSYKANSERLQHRKLETIIASQIEEVGNLQKAHELEWAKSPGNDSTIDRFLVPEELEKLARLKNHRREMHKRLLEIRRIELQQRECELFLQQYEKLRDIYEKKAAMPSIKADKKNTRNRLLEAQTGWLKHWDQLRDKETNYWKDLISYPRDKDSSLSILLSAMIDFCNLPYWSRLWIVQEVVLAKSLVLCFGDNAKTTIRWEVMKKARFSLDQIPVFWKLDSPLDAKIQIIKDSLAFQMDRLRDGNGEILPLHRLIQITQNALCKDPRDKIYGLLGLANDYKPGEIPVDYGMPIQDVYLETIRWYRRVHGSEHASPSVVSFSHALQLSLRGHAGSYSTISSQTQPTAREIFSELGADVFCSEGIIKGPILPIEQLMNDTELLNLRQRDWISIMIDYLDCSGNNMVRTGLEEKLLYLSSIVANFVIHPSTSSYVTEKKISHDSPILDLKIMQDAKARTTGRRNEDLQFFVLNNGQFGVSSTCIRDGDVLCQFEELATALILRRKNDHYILISRAVLAPSIPISAMASKTTFSRLIGSLASHEEPLVAKTPDSVVHVQFDTASLQQLTQPLNFCPVADSRQPLYILEADFGWYEFITFGYDAEANLVDWHELVTSGEDTEVYHVNCPRDAVDAVTISLQRDISHNAT